MSRLDEAGERVAGEVTALTENVERLTERVAELESERARGQRVDGQAGGARGGRGAPALPGRSGVQGEAVTRDPVDYSRNPVAPPAPPHPAPQIAARPATPAEICKRAGDVMKLARSAGWEVDPTYALGHARGVGGETLRLTHSLALRMRLPDTGYRAAAIWTAAALSGGEKLVWKHDSSFVQVVGHTGHTVRMVGLNGRKGQPEVLNLKAYLLDPSRLTDPSNVGSVSISTERSQS